MKNYTEEWNGFQIRVSVYLNKYSDPYGFDIVQWEDHEPYEVTDLCTGKRR